MFYVPVSVIDHSFIGFEPTVYKRKNINGCLFLSEASCINTFSYQPGTSLQIRKAYMNYIPGQWLETLTQEIHMTDRQLVNTGQPSIDISLKIGLLEVPI